MSEIPAEGHLHIGIRFAEDVQVLEIASRQENLYFFGEAIIELH